MESLLTVREASSYLNVHPKSIYRLVKRKEIPFIKRNGLGIRFLKRDIDEWLKKGSNKLQLLELFPKFEPKIYDYDKIFLKGRSVLGKSSKRWDYGFGKVYTRETKQGRVRYYIDYRDQSGKRKREVVKNAQTRSEAVLALQRKVAESFDNDYSPNRTKKLNFTEISELYLENYSKPNKKSWKCDYYNLEAHLKPFFGKLELNNITPLLIEKYRAERLKTGVEKSTTNRELALLKKMFNLAIDWGYLKENPVRKVKIYSEKDNIKERVLSEEEEKKLLKESTDHLKPIIITALNTGMRRGEVLNLKWDQVNLKERFILVLNTKSSKRRIVPINDLLYEVLHDLKKSTDSDYVFPNPETGKPLKTVRRGFENACRRAGIKNMRFHDLRHTFGSRLIREGVDIVTVQNLLGHHSITITQRYTHTNSDQTRNAVACLSKKKEPEMAKKHEKLSHIWHIAENIQTDKGVISVFSMN